MVEFTTQDMGGMVPRRDSVLLPPNMAEDAYNCDVASGPLDGLPQPLFVRDMAGTASFTVKKAYRVPGPNQGDPEIWIPLPSPYSSVVRSPLANDTLHRVYWSNPPNEPNPGVFWNTYARLAAGQPAYDLGFVPPNPSTVLTVTTSGGTIPHFVLVSATVADAGSGYVPGSVLTLVGGTLMAGAAATTLNIAQTQVVTIGVAAGGSGGIDGTVLMRGTTGVGTFVSFSGTVSGGALTAIPGRQSNGGYTTNPTNLASEPVVGQPGTPTGATVSLAMGVLGLTGRSSAGYTETPVNPVPTTCSGPGTGCTLTATYTLLDSLPFVTRSYVFTFIDEYGHESSPSEPSAPVEGPSNAAWTISGLPTAPPATPAGKFYPTVVKLRLYRTLTGASTGAQFYFVTDLAFSDVPAGQYVDTIPDVAVVGNNLLESTSWLPPVDNLDGLTALPGGMLVGFTGNTIHFCEPNRPHAWPAGYDQSLLYQIVSLAIWQQALIVLTHGYPSSGSGSAPSQFIFAQIQAPEPCIARGSVVTDLAGVYYASENGLITLNYYGMQNQSLSNFTKNIWLKDYQAANIIACRHRAQYLAINGTGTGFLIDYTEERMGVMKVSPFVNVVGVWNDVFTGDPYVMADQKVYLWDSPDTPALIYYWKSKEFYLPSPTNLGCCQISVDPAILAPVPTPLSSYPEDRMNIVLPDGVNAVFRLYSSNDDQLKLVFTRYLTKPLEIFRLPSGLKSFNWQFDITARVPIHSVQLATTMKELKGG